MAERRKPLPREMSTEVNTIHPVTTPTPVEPTLLAAIVAASSRTPSRVRMGLTANNAASPKAKPAAALNRIVFALPETPVGRREF